MKTKSWWKKLPLDEKIILILFISGLIFLIVGLIMLLNINLDQDKTSFMINGFNLIYIHGLIGALQYTNAAAITLFFLKTGIIFTVFLMPLYSSISIIWFIIKRLILKK